MKLKSASLALIVVLAQAFTSSALATQLNGGGSSFIYPVFSQWAASYYQQHNQKINYQSIGSGGGIRQITQKTVHFAATDAPLTQQELEENDLAQFPLIMGGIIPAHNIAGIESNALRLDGPTLAEVFSGKITHWNDAKIQALNPSLKLPNQAITVVRRADGSGSTWMLTNYLSKVSPQWQEEIGSDKAVNWPVGVGAKGNEGVASYIKRINGSIGYVELAYVLNNDMKAISLKNQAGNYVSASINSLKAAAAHADWETAPGMAVILTNQPGEQSWPITGATFVLASLPLTSNENKILQEFLSWAWRDGASQAVDLAYVPLPINLVNKIEALWENYEQ